MWNPQQAQLRPRNSVDLV
ncbi:hypothetical protein Bhyg_10307 [Pseudolycoriella hygida]|uniref:Uncharacterized protein n=1 Tax=Pseudolycoriella hygida TaxID=35572 RepID=A0A9Q0RYW1_9DIPT|nr:hypothetical protein Bhyg_10307 [Pseudolycoriella hygida]